MRIDERYLHDHEGFTTFFDIKLFVIMGESQITVQVWSAGLAW